MNVGLNNFKIFTFNNNEMKLITTTKVAIALSMLIFSSCEDQDVNPSANVTRQDRTIEDYSGIEISTAFTVDVTFSSTENKIEIEANENLHALIDVVKSGNNLVIKLKDNSSIHGNSTLRAHIITSNSLEELLVSGASVLLLKNQLDVNEISIGVSGASSLTGSVIANSIGLHIDGASNVSLEGRAEQMYINGSGASTIGGYSMEITNLNCKLDGASQSNLTIINELELVASGASVLVYKGTPQINTLQLSGASQIIRVD